MATLTWPVVDPKTGKTGTVTATLPPITAPSAGMFPGDPGKGRILIGQTEDPKRGGVNYIPTRAAQYASDLGMSAGTAVHPDAFHGYIQPVPDSSAVAAANAELGDIDKVQAWGGYSATDIKETQYTLTRNIGTHRIGDVIQHTFDDVANGSSDAMFDTLVTGIVQRRKPAALFFHNEPVGDTVGIDASGAGVLATPASTAAAVDRLRQRIVRQAGDDFITWGCSLGIGSFSTYGGNNGPPDPWIAALAPVSKVLPNNRYQQATDTSGTWKTPAQLYQPFWDLQNRILDGLGLPRMARMVLEYGTHTRSSDLGYAPAWMDAFYQLCLAYDVRASFYFDSGQNSANDWTLDLNGETSRRRKFAQQIMYPTSGYAHTA